MGTDADDNAFARQISEYKGRRLKYIDYETGEEKEGILEGVWTHSETKRLVAHFQRSNVFSQILLAPKKVPLRRVLLPSQEKETKGHSAGSRNPVSSRNASGNWRPQTRRTFQYYNHYYTVTSLRDFKADDEVVWCKYSSDEHPCLGKVVVTAERDDVLDGLNYQEVSIVQFDSELFTSTGDKAPGHFAYLSGVNYTYVVPMKELLTLPEWISIRTTEEEGGWTKVENRKKGKRGQHQQSTDFFDEGDYEDFQSSHSRFQKPHGSKEPSTSKKWTSFEDDHNTKFSEVQEPSQQKLYDFTPKWEDEWQYPLNKIEFFKQLEKSSGNGMGVQGNNNSCYMDSSLFALFAFNESLDNSLLQLNSDSGQSINYKLKRVIRDSVIFPMRHRPYVPHEHVYKLRKLLAKNIRQDYLSRYMDVEEFLMDLFKLMDIPPFLQYDNDEGDYIHQITLPFTWEENQYQPYLTMQSLLENSFSTFDVKLKNRPEGVFVLKLPISDGVLIPCKGIIPNLTLDLSGVLNDPENATRHYRIMHLHAVICLKRSHFVVFVRTGKEDNSPWVFMDSNPTTQRPSISVLPDVDKQIMQAVDQVESEMPPKSIKYEPTCEGFALFRNAYVCIYV